MARQPPRPGCRKRLLELFAAWNFATVAAGALTGSGGLGGKMRVMLGIRAGVPGGRGPVLGRHGRVASRRCGSGREGVGPKTAARRKRGRRGGNRRAPRAGESRFPFGAAGSQQMLKKGSVPQSTRYSGRNLSLYKLSLPQIRHPFILLFAIMLKKYVELFSIRDIALFLIFLNTLQFFFN